MKVRWRSMGPAAHQRQSAGAGVDVAGADVALVSRRY